MYIVVEIQTGKDGAVGTLINSYDDRRTAESRYHQILSAAAVSSLSVHAAMLMTERGKPLKYEFYDNGSEEAE